MLGSQQKKSWREPVGKFIQREMRYGSLCIFTSGNKQLNKTLMNMVQKQSGHRRPHPNEQAV